MSVYIAGVGFLPAPGTPPKSVDYFDHGNLNSRCQNCQAFKFSCENISCCSNGQITLPLPKSLPNAFKELLTTHSENSKIFRKNIRIFNSLFTFTSSAIKTTYKTTGSKVFLYFQNLSDDYPVFTF